MFPPARLSFNPLPKFSSFTENLVTTSFPAPQAVALIKDTFQAFRYSEFRLMWMGACTSSIGTWMQQLAQSWLVYDISRSAKLLALDAFLAEIPIFLFSLFGGVLSDRMDRRKLLIVSQLIQMSCAFTLALLLYSNAVEVWHILCLSFVVGCAQSIGGPAYQALVPTLVPKELLPNAIALNSIQFNLARVIGPVLGGIALAKLGAVWCFGLNGFSYIAVIGSLLFLKERPPASSSQTSVLDSLKEGLRFVAAKESMLSLILLAFLMTFFSFATITFLPVMAREVLKLNADGYSQLMSISGAGSVVGALFVATFSQKIRKGAMALSTLVILGLLTMGYSLSNSFYASAILIFLSGAALIIVFALIASLVQMLVEDHMRGRVMSIFNVALRSGRPFGSLVTGFLIPVLSAPYALALNGALLAAMGIGYLLFARNLRKL